MATIKSFTSLEQSRKLAEILSFESADMKWFFWESDIDAHRLPTFGYSKDDAENYKSAKAVYLPCWSLSALLELFDDKAGIAKEYGTWFAYDNGKSHCSEHYDNPLDAAFEMVVWLKETGKI